MVVAQQVWGQDLSIACPALGSRSRLSSASPCEKLAAAEVETPDVWAQWTARSTILAI